jgi:ABC-type antimicrobial peptide transport system ATPase subunit
MGTLLDIEDLVVNFYTYRGVVKALDRINLVINHGETVGRTRYPPSRASVAGLHET